MKKIKKIISLSIFIIVALAVLILFLNIEATTRQGINYKVNTIRLPLYLKLMDFYDRHFNYKWLVYRITAGKTSQKDKVMALFKWTHENIREQPKELPIIDDHIWHIIVRSYGTGDQFSDVFTTLCNYAHFDAFFYRLYNKENTSKITFSLVKIGNRWCFFEPRYGVYFVNSKNEFASVEEIAKGDWEVRIIDGLLPSGLNYADYLREIPSFNLEQYHKVSRANIQSPLNRLFYGIKKRLMQK